MTEQQIQNATKEQSAQISETHLTDLAKLLIILSKVDALTIFFLAREGLIAEMHTAQDIGITRKPYYTRLKQLVDSGLLVRRKGAYFHTTMGSIIYEKHIVSLLRLIQNANQMKMIDALKNEQRFPKEEISNLVQGLYKHVEESSSSFT